jgi:hypothetical protein
MTLSDLLIAEELKELRESENPEDVIKFYELLDIANDYSLHVYITQEHYSIPQ